MALSITSNKKQLKALVSFYGLEAKLNTGEIISFENFRGKKVLIVNVASNCGFTPQYDELEKLQQLYKNDLTILGFPSDDFGGQEPGTDDEIASFCKVNFGVTFRLFQKHHVKGSDKQLVYQWLCDAGKNGWNNEDPAWNFYKFLVNEEGTLKNFFSSAVSPLSDELLNPAGILPK